MEGKWSMGITRRCSNNGNVRVLATLAGAMIDRDTGLRVTLMLCLAMEIIVIGLSAGSPYLLKVLIDGLSHDVTTLEWATVLSVLFVVASLGGSVLAAWRQVFSQKIIDRLNEEIVDDVLKRAMPDLAGPRDGDTGRILGLIERLPFGLQILVGGLIWQVLPTFLQVGISLVIIASVLKPLYVAVLAVTLVAFTVATWYGATQQHQVSAAASAASGNVSETVADILRNARRVVLNGALPQERRLVRERFGERAHAFSDMLASHVGVAALQYGVAGTGVCGLLVLGARDALDGAMTIGGLVLLQAYAFRLVLPLSGFGYVISQAALALITVRDILELGREEEGAKESARAPGSGAAGVELRSISFAYGVGLPGVQDISLTLQPGSFNVLVGPNGSGKSTLAQIMAGILRPDKGEVLIDDFPLDRIPRGQRYQYVLYVPQTVTLLNRSLLANALYPPSRLTEAELMQLLMDWRFHDPDRDIDLTASAGELGERLSGGQRQKLELARIARTRVPVIILDESTSALDPASEAEVIWTLRQNHSRETTLVLITHRLALVEAADQVLFLKNGTLVRSGTHQTLLQDSAAYGRLWQDART
jgi:ABC-type bacteriocin/lantibiotic exporter with double-glycine peptidase domain